MTLAGQVEQEPPGEIARKTKKRKKISTGEGRLAVYLIAPTIAMLGLVVGYPIVKAIYQSFLTDQGLDKNGFFNQGGKWNGVGHYRDWLLQQCPKPGGGTASCP